MYNVNDLSMHFFKTILIIQSLKIIHLHKLVYGYDQYRWVDEET